MYWNNGPNLQRPRAESPRPLNCSFLGPTLLFSTFYVDRPLSHVLPHVLKHGAPGTLHLELRGPKLWKSAGPGYHVQKKMQKNFGLKGIIPLIFNCDLEDRSGARIALGVHPTKRRVGFSFHSPSDKFKFVPRPISLAGGTVPMGSRHTSSPPAAFIICRGFVKRSLSAQGLDVLVQPALFFHTSICVL
jgi:hypothetical protein